jgi:hypothetical protein
MRPEENHAESKSLRESTDPGFSGSHPENQTFFGGRRESEQIIAKNRQKTPAGSRGGTGMIAPMTKYSFLVYHLDYEPFLDKLRELGIAHIIENNQEVSPEILEQFQQINQVNRIIRTLNNLEPDSPEINQQRNSRTERSCIRKSLRYNKKSKHSTSQKLLFRSRYPTSALGEF